MEFILSAFGDWAASAVAAIIGFGYRQTLARIGQYSADLASRLTMLAGKAWHHKVAVRVRSLIWLVLLLCQVSLVVVGVWSIGSSGLYFIEIMDSLPAYGTQAFWPRVAGMVVSIVITLSALAVAFVVNLIVSGLALWRLRRVRDIPFGDLTTLFGVLPDEPVDPGPTATPAEQAAYNQAMVPFQAAVDRIIQILDAAGPTGRLGTGAFVALILPLFVSGIACFIANSALYTWFDLPWEYGLFSALVFVALILSGVMAVLLTLFIIAMLIRVVGDAVNGGFRTVVTSFAVAFPGITWDNFSGIIDKIVGKLAGLPTEATANKIQEVSYGPAAGIIMLVGFAAFFPDMRFVSAFLLYQMVRGGIEWARHRYAKLEPLKYIQRAFLFFEGVLLPGIALVQLLLLIGKRLLKWTGRDLVATKDQFINMHERLMSTPWWLLLIMLVVIPIVISVIFYFSGKIELKPVKFTVRGLTAPLGWLVFVILVGLCIKAANQRERVVLDFWGVRNNYSYLPPIPTTARRSVVVNGQARPPSTQAAAPSRPAATSSVVAPRRVRRPAQPRVRPQRREQVRLAQRDPCARMTADFRHSPLGQRLGCR